jgi:LysM repeat protein
MSSRHALFAALAVALFTALALPASAAPALDTTYKVQSGDTLSAIGARCGVEWSKIARANSIANPSRLAVGQTLKVPGSKGCAAAPARKSATSGQAAAPSTGGAPAVAAAAAPAGFGYGVQLHAPGGDQHAIDMVKGMGFNWVKQQVEWHRYEGSKGAYGFGELDGLVNQANAAGINVLFSVVKAPGWARGNSDFSVEGPPANPQDMADFMGAMAAHFQGRVRAYEIWNEQNLHYEWGNEPLDAGRYVQLLCAVYRAVKASDPGAIVVSGALTPTGVNDGSRAVDDVTYLRRMYAAGVRGCANGIGAHPSGYNNPASSPAGSVADAAEPQFKGHRSFYFRGTMESYRNVMANAGDAGKKIWVTEFGWASTENLGAGPAGGYEYAGQNTEGEQAQFLVDAFNLARRWGWVGPMFVWNLNFAPVSGPADEKAAFSLVRADWSPRPAYDALKNMGK